MQTQQGAPASQSTHSAHNLPQMDKHSANDAAVNTPLARALEQNEAATDAVQKSVDDLMVINAVLKQEIPKHVQVGDVAQALQKTDELEVKIQDTAQELALVNEALSHEIAERGELEDELRETKAKLARAAHKA